MRTRPISATGRARAGAVIAILVAVLVSSCSVGPSRRPPLAVSGGHVTGSAAQASTSSRTPPTGPGGPGRTSAPITWTQCGAAAVRKPGFALACGRVTVPVSYTDSSQGIIDLHISRASSPTADPHASPIVVLWGDPGEIGADGVATIAADLPTDITDVHPVVTWDLRGTGGSSGIDCVSDDTERAIFASAAEPTTADGTDRWHAISRQLAFDCSDLAGAKLGQFNSTNAADDLDTLRAALGVPTVTVLGRGFGATLAAVYADRYPGRIDRLVLDSPRDPVATPEHQAKTRAEAAAALLTDFAAACQRFPSGCPLGDDPVEAINEIVHSLADRALKTGTWTMTGGSIATALLELLPHQDQWPDLAAAIAAVRAGDGADLVNLWVTALGGEAATIRLTGRVLFACNDTATRLTGDELDRAIDAAAAGSALFGPAAIAPAAWCAGWPAPEETVGRVSAAGSPPILVLGSVRNIRHPLVGVQSVANQLASAVLVSWQSAADGAYPTNACVTQTVDDYLLHGTVPDIGVLCPP